MDSDQTLIKGIKDGDNESFEKIYLKYKDKLYFFCLKQIRSDYIAREILQDTFIKVWNYRQKIDEKMNFEGFLFTLMKNRLINYLKADEKRKYHHSICHQYAPDLSEETENDIIYNNYTQVVGEAVESLASRRKEVFKLSRENGFTYKEIATTLGISVNTVEIHMGNALRDIRNYLDKHIGNEICNFS